MANRSVRGRGKADNNSGPRGRLNDRLPIRGFHDGPSGRAHPKAEYTTATAFSQSRSAGTSCRRSPYTTCYALATPAKRSPPTNLLRSGARVKHGRTREGAPVACPAEAGERSCRGQMLVGRGVWWSEGPVGRSAAGAEELGVLARRAAAKGLAVADCDGSRKLEQH